MLTSLEAQKLTPFSASKTELTSSAVTGWQNVSVKGHVRDISGTESHMVSVARIQLYSCSVKAAINNM